MSIQIKIHDPTYEDGVSRISADVNDSKVWFESPDVKLASSPEGFVSAFVVPALKKQHPLEISHKLDLVWKENTSKLQDTLHSWWGCAPIEIQEGRESIAHKKPSEAAGLFFTCGVDSFFSLLDSEYKDKIRYLIFVHGYDVALGDKWRTEQTIKSVQSVAQSLSIKAIVVRTNLRELPLVNSVDWGYEYHGSALAAVGHFLEDACNKIIISSSYPYAVPRTWGSRWDLDPLWSSLHVSFLHVGADVYRSEKLRRMIKEPLVQRYLRVCWQNKQGTLNCGECEKCIRTMLVLMQRKKLDLFSLFKLTVPMDKWEAYVEERVPKVTKKLLYIYEEMAQSPTKDPRIARVIRGILWRSKNPLLYGLGRLRVFIRRIGRRLQREFSKNN